MEQLKLCPFCGSTDTLLFHDTGCPSETHGQYEVYCSSCGCSTKFFDAPEEALEAWNRRTTDG